MVRKAVRVEFFYAGGCDRCAEARAALRDAAQTTRGADWREVDVGKDPKRAADVGVFSTPAVAIDGELVFKSMPSTAQLKKAIAASAGKG
jgi:glutaredoxin